VPGPTSVNIKVTRGRRGNTPRQCCRLLLHKNQLAAAERLKVKAQREPRGCSASMREPFVRNALDRSGTLGIGNGAKLTGRGQVQYSIRRWRRFSIDGRSD
jgi:hypothetical protein